MILYKRDSGQYVLHRIVGSREDGFILVVIISSLMNMVLRSHKLLRKWLSLNAMVRCIHVNI